MNNLIGYIWDGAGCMIARGFLTAANFDASQSKLKFVNALGSGTFSYKMRLHAYYVQ